MTCIKKFRSGEPVLWCANCLSMLEMTYQPGGQDHTIRQLRQAMPCNAHLRVTVRPDLG